MLGLEVKISICYAHVSSEIKYCYFYEKVSWHESSLALGLGLISQFLLPCISIFYFGTVLKLCLFVLFAISMDILDQTDFSRS